MTCREFLRVLALFMSLRRWEWWKDDILKYWCTLWRTTVVEYCLCNIQWQFSTFLHRMFYIVCSIDWSRPQEACMVLATYRPRHLMDRTMAMICMPRKLTMNNKMQKRPLSPRSPISLDLDCCSVEWSRERWKKNTTALQKLKTWQSSTRPFRHLLTSCFLFCIIAMRDCLFLSRTKLNLDNHLHGSFGIYWHHGFFFA